MTGFSEAPWVLVSGSDNLTYQPSIQHPIQPSSVTSKVEWRKVAAICAVAVAVVAAIGLYYASVPPQRSGTFLVTVAVDVDDSDKAAKKTFSVRVMVDEDTAFDAVFNNLGDWAPHTEAIDRSWTNGECTSFLVVASLKGTSEALSRRTDLCNGDIQRVRFDFKT